eukprot:143833-Karenia_brevis.AAC.1
MLPTTSSSSSHGNNFVPFNFAAAANALRQSHQVSVNSAFEHSIASGGGQSGAGHDPISSTPPPLPPPTQLPPQTQ